MHAASPKHLTTNLRRNPRGIHWMPSKTHSASPTWRLSHESIQEPTRWSGHCPHKTSKHASNPRTHASKNEWKNGSHPRASPAKMANPINQGPMATLTGQNSAGIPPNTPSDHGIVAHCATTGTFHHRRFFQPINPAVAAKLSCVPS